MRCAVEKCPRPPRKWSLFTLSFVTVSLCAGLVYGWPALRRNLRDVGGSTLSEQTLGGIYTAGAWSTQGGRFAFGLARDRYGTRRTTLVSLLCVIGGSVGIALSDPNGAVQLGVSLFLIGLGSGAQLCLQPVAGLFEKSGTVIASLSGAFQVSGLIFLALTSITNIRKYSFIAFSVVIAALAIASAFMLPWGPSFVLPIPSNSCHADDAEETPDTSSTPPVENEDANIDTNQQQPEAATPTSATISRKEHKSLARRFYELLFRVEYIALLAWFSVCIIPLQYYVGSIGFQLEEKGDDDGYYTSLFAILYASAAALAPFGGYLADVIGLGVTQGLATTLCAASFFILASYASLNIQAVGLAIYGVGRMLVFGMYFSNVGKRFGYANYGLLAGLGLLISALISLVQYPLIALSADGKARQVNLSCGAALVCILPYCAWLCFRERRRQSPLAATSIRDTNRAGTDTDNAVGIEPADDLIDSEDVHERDGCVAQRRQGRRQTFMASFLRKPSYFAQ